jgi:hypothetical protein
MAENKSDRLSDTRIEDLKRCLQQSIGLGESPPCLVIDEAMRLVHEVQESRQILDPVRSMIGEEASSVTLVADNPEFHGVDSCVFVVNAKTGWNEIRVVGSSMSDALLNASTRFGK